MVPSIRPAAITEAELLANLSIMASGGTFELLLQNMKRNLSVHQILSELCRSDNTEYSYQFFRVAELQGRPLGAVNLISVRDRYRLAPNINPLLQQNFGFGWQQLLKFYLRARHIRNMRTIKCPEHSCHINDIAVMPEARGLGVGAALIKHSKEEAANNGHKYLSLYVWADNTDAIRFYQRHGFSEQGRAEIKPHRLLPHSASVLMLYPLS